MPKFVHTVLGSSVMLLTESTVVDGMKYIVTPQPQVLQDVSLMGWRSRIYEGTEYNSR
jgi:hypothetical protein